MSFSKLFSRFLRTFSAFKKFHCCSIFKDQFCPVFQPVFRASTWQLTYYTLIVYNCQYLFWNFFRFFWTFLALEIFGYTLYAIYINAGFKRRFALLISTVRALSPQSLRAHTYIKRMIFSPWENKLLQKTMRLFEQSDGGKFGSVKKLIKDIDK